MHIFTFEKSILRLLYEGSFLYVLRSIFFRKLEYISFKPLFFYEIKKLKKSQNLYLRILPRSKKIKYPQFMEGFECSIAKSIWEDLAILKKIKIKMDTKLWKIFSIPTAFPAFNKKFNILGYISFIFIQHKLVITFFYSQVMDGHLCKIIIRSYYLFSDALLKESNKNRK